MAAVFRTPVLLVANEYRALLMLSNDKQYG